MSIEKNIMYACENQKKFLVPSETCLYAKKPTMSCTTLLAPKLCVTPKKAQLNELMKSHN